MRILFSLSAPNDMRERKRLDRETIKRKIQARANTQGKKKIKYSCLKWLKTETKLDTGKNSPVKIIPEVSQRKRLSLVVKIHLGSKEYRNLLGVMTMFYKLVVMVFLQAYSAVNIHQIVHFKGMQFIAHKVHLNKADYKTESKTFIYGACMRGKCTANKWSMNNDKLSHFQKSYCFEGTLILQFISIRGFQHYNL